ncbi:hypothetical protein B4U80_01240 [Leptotrombidium deliense]|uniref:G-protein coupled receptors family 2 profile 1 domain-containing protein n=1 Tax=Leptotrombidium deliense TaxID=299467 RepID=A0A443SPJ0_9ACAR|nr:hypothetical protein B4U80_01240 [Leptotrombidium deliense]
MKSTTKSNVVVTTEKQKKEEDVESHKETVNADGGDDEDRDSILPYRRCLPEHFIDVHWNLTDAGVLALRPCPLPYSGSVYRPCYSSGSWGKPDYTECRLPHLREIQNLIFYHVHKHLVDGLYPLAEELSRLVTSERYAIKSPMDRLDAFDALNAILRAKIKIRMEDETKDLTLIRVSEFRFTSFLLKCSAKRRVILSVLLTMLFVLWQSLTSTADQLLTGTQVSFAVEAEKNVRFEYLLFA